MTIDRETVIRLAREADCNTETERVLGISGLQRFATLVLEHGRKPLTDAGEHLRDLVTAIDGAFISSWQSTAAWQKQLDAAREYLDANSQQGE